MVLYACEACRTVYLWPLPSERAVHAMYDDPYQGATTSYFSKIDKKMRRSRRRLRRLARSVRAGRFLDIGCSGGFVVEAAREQGFDAHGLDIDPVSVRYATEHYPRNRFFLGSVEQFAPDAPRFDLIYCSEVIEHVPAVQRFVATIAGLLAPGGHLFVTTPNIGHWRRPRRLTAWDGFAPPAHCIYFRPSGLRALLERHGLAVVRTHLAWKPGIKMLCRAP